MLWHLAPAVRRSRTTGLTTLEMRRAFAQGEGVNATFGCQEEAGPYPFMSHSANSLQSAFQNDLCVFEEMKATVRVPVLECSL